MKRINFLKTLKMKIEVRNRYQLYIENKFIASIASDYNADQIEIKEKGESWLDMRKRTEPEREKAKLKQEKLTLFLSKAPEMYEVLKMIHGRRHHTNFTDSLIEKIESLYKEINNG